MTLDERINKNLDKKLKEIEEKKSKKKFNIPFWKRVGTAKKKQNYVTLIKLNENGQIKFDVKQIKNQTIMEEGIPRLATSEYVFHFKKNPCIILPSWSFKPLSASENSKESLENGNNIKGYAILLEKMQQEQLGAKKQISGIAKLIIGLAFAAIIGYAFISGGI
jgi:plasmid maintenance system killer protein